MRVRNIIVTIAVAAGALGLAFSAIASISSDSTQERARGGARVVPAVVPKAAEDAFGILRATAATGEMPGRVRAFISSDTTQRLYAPNADIARAIPAPVGADQPDWFLVPGDDSACLHVGEAGSCATIDEANRGLLAIIAIDEPGPAPAIVNGRPARAASDTRSTDPLMRVLGVARDGIVSVRADSASGVITAPVKSNVYLLEGRGLSNVTLVGRDGLTMALPGWS